MRFSHGNWLARHVFPLQVTIYLVGLKAWGSVIYFPSGDKCNGTEIESKCEHNGTRGVRINDTGSLHKVLGNINDSVEYWTGLSWHPDWEYSWYLNKSLPTRVEENLTDLNNTWFCFLVKKGETKLIAERCDESHNYICQDRYCNGTCPTCQSRTCIYCCQEEPPWKCQDSACGTLGCRSTIIDIYCIRDESTDSACGTLGCRSTIIDIYCIRDESTVPHNASQLNCTESNFQGLAMIQNETQLQKVLFSVSNDSKEYWTALSWHNKFDFRWNQNKKLPVKSEDILLEVKNTSFCFLLSNRQLVAKRCDKVHNYICEQDIMTSSGTSGVSVATSIYKLEKAIEEIKALNATEKGSLNVSVKIVGNVFKELKDEREKVNFLVVSQALETFAVEYATIHLKENGSDIISEETYAMKIQKVAANNKEALVFSVTETPYFSPEEDWAGITLPSEVLRGEGVVVFIVYDNISELVPDTEQTGLDGKKIPKLNLRGRIIAATVSPPPESILQENATISFSFNKESDEQETPHCVFWNFTVKSEVNGSWSKKGCSLVKTEDDNISCACNHLTNFAVLMQVGESEVPSEHRLALEVITYAGCALSLIGEILTIIAYCTLTNFKEEQIQIRLNLVIALAIAQIAFLSGINAIEPEGLCVFIAAFIHYFYLVGFAWMLFEGVYLYLNVVKVFNTEVRMRLFLAVAWGVPAGIVALSIAFASSQDGGIHSYVNGAFCWVSFKNQITWTFVAPVLVICVINMVLLSLVIHEILKMQRNKKSDVERLGQSVKACVVLFPLLGLTWVFGVLSLTNASLAFQYIFTILNSLQGFFIFVLHVLRSTDVRAEFKRKTQRWMMNGLSFNHVADWPHSTYVWPNNAVNSDVYELNEKPKTTSPSATTSRYHSPIEAPQHGAFTTVDM